MLHGLTPQERADLYLSVIVAETDPTKHPSWHHDWVFNAVDNITSYHVSEEVEGFLREMEEKGDFLVKGVYDYIYALEQCYETGTPYIGIFEDDIMLADGWLIRTLKGLQNIPPPHDESGSWLFMRLFNQERSTGWAHRHIGGNNEHWIALGIGLTITIGGLLARSCSRSARTRLNLSTIFVVALILNPAMVVLFYQSGKASLLPPSPGVFAEGFGCCSQAMIFPRAQVPPLMEFLRKERQGQVDLLLKKRAKQTGLTRYSLYPVQAQHIGRLSGTLCIFSEAVADQSDVIGIDSARKTDKDEAQAIWSMAYEDLDPGVLERTHLQMVQEYYGKRGAVTRL